MSKWLLHRPYVIYMDVMYAGFAGAKNLPRQILINESQKNDVISERLYVCLFDFVSPHFVRKKEDAHNFCLEK